MLEDAIGNGLRSITWELDAFAYADSWDEAAGRYRGLTTGLQHTVHVNINGQAVLVHPEVANRQFRADEAATSAAGEVYTPGEGESGTGSGVGKRGPESQPGGEPAVIDPPARQNPRRYFGSVSLNPQTLASQVSEISKEVVANLQGIYGANVRISLEIEADVPDGIPEGRRRAVEEKTKDLKFDQSDFAGE